jgi:hypothetical protein
LHEPESWQIPLPWQIKPDEDAAGHLDVEQLLSLQCFLHVHLPVAVLHFPCPEQLFGHARKSQALPAYPAAHVHLPFLWLQKPLPLQLFNPGHSLYAQS